MNARIYRDETQWVLWLRDIDEKLYFDSETEAMEKMAEMTKEGQFIEDVRQFARDYRLMMERAHSLTERWETLFQSLIDEASFDPEHLGIVPTNESRLTSFTSVISNLGTLYTTFDGGTDTNLEKVA
jgi:hypothetical protein